MSEALLSDRPAAREAPAPGAPARPPVTLHRFRGARGDVAVALPFALDAVLADVAALRRRMVRRRPDVFRREEWAYLLQFLGHDTLTAPFEDAFGARVPDGAGGPVALLARPRGTVSVWLPGNVSLLGPLTVVLLALTANRLLLKGSSNAEDLTGAFLAFAREELPDGPLRAHLAANVEYEVFDRADPRSARWAADGDLRVVFGGDAAAAAVDALPHPLESGAAYFVDRRSEAWITPAAATDALLADLARVFAVYGQAGCTSPSRVVVLDGTPDDARRVRDRLAAVWADAVKADPAPHLASANVLAWQWCVAQGVDAVRAPRNAAVLAAVAPDAVVRPSAALLPVTAAPLETALGQLPAHVQTLGVGAEDFGAARWLDIAARSGVRRIVPVPLMHHFSHVWDGRRFWAEAFSYVAVAG
jgi:hypothetical protein